MRDRRIIARVRATARGILMRAWVAHIARFGQVVFE